MTGYTAAWPTYLKRAFLSPGQVFMGLLLVGALALPTGNLINELACGAVVVLVDAALLLAMSCAPGYRRLVDEDLAEDARQAAAAARAALLEQMSDVHRQQLREIEWNVDAMRNSSVVLGAAVEPLLEACGEIVVVFVRLAIRHRRAQTCLDSVDRAKLGDEMSILEQVVAASSGVIRDQARHRLALMRERVRLWEVGCARLQGIEEQLALFVERVRLAREKNAPRASEPRGFVVRVEIPDDQELGDMRVEEEVDARMLALGRLPR